MKLKNVSALVTMLFFSIFFFIYLGDIKKDTHKNVGGLEEEYNPGKYHKILSLNAPKGIPLGYSVKRQITSPFNIRYGIWDSGKLYFHNGIDIAGLWDQEICSTGDGIVLNIWKRHKVYGKCIEILHGNGYVTFYAHLSTIYVNKGDRIVSGEVIGRMGNTGMSDGQHLHYEVRLNGNPINPLLILDISPDENGFF